MRFLYWLVTAVIALFIVDFAVSNRDVVTLSLWPFANATTELFVPVLLASFFAFLLGLLVAWIWSWRVRRHARMHARRVEALEREVKRHQERAAGSGAIIEGRPH